MLSVYKQQAFSIAIVGCSISGDALDCRFCMHEYSKDGCFAYIHYRYEGWPGCDGYVYLPLVKVCSTKYTV